MLRLASAPRNTLLKLRHFPPCKMAVTRSATGALPKKAAAVGDPPAAEVKKTSTTKRKAAGKVATEATSEVPRASNRKKSKVEASNGAANDVSDTTAAQNTKIVLAPVLSEDDSDAPVLVPAVLTFSFEEAKQHLITIDRRFEEMFYRLKCKPFEHLERLDPFRYVHSSWFATALTLHGQDTSQFYHVSSVTRQYSRSLIACEPADNKYRGRRPVLFITASSDCSILPCQRNRKIIHSQWDMLYYRSALDSSSHTGLVSSSRPPVKS